VYLAIFFLLTGKILGKIIASGKKQAKCDLAKFFPVQQTSNHRTAILLDRRQKICL
jgi:lauroyl/myristoyl acyltransferase